MTKTISHQQLLELLDYDPLTGVFRWRVDRHRAKRGDVAGCSDKCHGYVRLMIDGVSHLAHRLAWFWVTGSWPADELDHKDLNKSNNMFCNLREASSSLNKRNSATYSNNKVGLKGVCLNKRGGKYRAQISINGSTKRIGSFLTAEEAHAAYVAEASRLFGDYARAA